MTARLVLSRKGFDSTTGGGDSPLLDDGRLLSLPIPDGADGRRRRDALARYRDVLLDGTPLAEVLRQLHPRARGRQTHVHLDPDLAASWLRGRSASAFRGLLGQAGAAAGHLVEQDVGEGALFLFFGRFRRAARRRNGELAWEPGSAPFHAVFGYLEVDHRIDLPAGGGSVEARDAKAFAPSFPHFHELTPRRVLVYVARRRLSFEPSRPGFGLFRYRDELRLTHPAASRLTSWRLPTCFSEVKRLTYHPPPPSGGWCVVDGHVELRAASRGQEFVCEPPPSVAAWAQELVAGSELWDPSRPHLVGPGASRSPGSTAPPTR